METPNVACLPTVLVSDIPTSKQYFVPNAVTRCNMKLLKAKLIGIQNLYCRSCEEKYEVPVKESWIGKVDQGKIVFVTESLYQFNSKLDLVAFSPLFVILATILP